MYSNVKVILANLTFDNKLFYKCIIDIYNKALELCIEIWNETDFINKI